MINARWLANMCDFRHSALRLQTAKNIIDVKIARSNVLLKKYKRQPFVVSRNNREVRSIQLTLLFEARAARYYWKEISQILPKWSEFSGRQPRRHDPVNVLLDIGYHHLTGKVKKILDAQGIASALGILHSPRSSTSAPLAYDLVEMFRADIVDTELVRFFRLKKKPIEQIGQSETAQFVLRINKRLERRYYLRNFRQCHTYNYYMYLQTTKFVAAVNHRQAFTPIHLPNRHDNRCQ